MAQSGDGVTADAVGSATTNLLTSPARKVFLINRGATEVRVRVVWEGGPAIGNTSGHTGSNYATMQANEPRTFGSENGVLKIKELYVHTAASTSTVDWHVKAI